MKSAIKKILPTKFTNEISRFLQGIRRSKISEPVGELDPFSSKKTFVMVVGQTFDYRRPDAMFTNRIGYCNGFELIGIPYIIVDIRDLEKVLPSIPNPFCMVYAADLIGVSPTKTRILKNYPVGIWTQPWFKESDAFFEKHNMNPRIWDFEESLKKKVLDIEANFGFTATVTSGLNFFEEWDSHGLKTISLPLACDTKLYTHNWDHETQPSEDIQLAFVGGYWQSKGKQIDLYLKPWEKQLTVYGYSQWPYAGYNGLLPREQEPLLYRSAKVCPVVNEPTVALLKGQINERVFKVLGSGGCPVVDAVPAYRELYEEDELLVADSPEHFHALVQELLINSEMNYQYRKKGYIATMEKHTYKHRAQEFLKECGFPTFE